MRYTIIFASIVLLSGCQSEFDKCMETEAPRAESILALSDMAAAITEFKSTSNFFTKVQQANANFQIERANSEPSGRPVMPSYPSYGCSGLSGNEFWRCSDAHDKLVEKYKEEESLAAKSLESWNARPDVAAWNDEYDSKLLAALNSVGFNMASVEEFERLAESKEAEYEALRNKLKSRARGSDCWGKGADKCYDPIGAELESEFGEELSDADYQAKYVEIGKRAIAEILVTMTEEYSVAKTKASELAVLTCNQNGFYE